MYARMICEALPVFFDVAGRRFFELRGRWHEAESMLLCSQESEYNMDKNSVGGVEAYRA